MITKKLIVRALFISVLLTTIINDKNIAFEIKKVNIYNLQGESHISPYINQQIKTIGMVTAVKKNGFYIQDSKGDNNELTSDSIFVLTKAQPEVKTGDEVEIEGKISEFIPRDNNLSITTLNSTSVTVLSSNNHLPPAVIIGSEGRQPPTEIIDDDFLILFNPRQDGIDFYESLEGMRVTVKDAIAVSPVNRFGEIFTVADRGINASGLSSRKTITISKDDFNPERIQIQQDKDLFPDFPQNVKVGDSLGDITGIMSYNFGNYEILVTEPFTVTPSNLQPEITSLIPTENQLTIASYNVLNLDPNDNDGDKDIEEGIFTAIASQIVNNLKTPDIIALQEIQDNSGSTDDGITEADITYQTLIAEIHKISDVNYQFIDIPPENNQDGGQLGGNIRVGYLYNPQRVTLISNSVTKINESAFNKTRKPLVATFIFKDQEFTLINNHFSSKGDSTPLFGKEQPPINGGEEERINQARVINDYVKDLLTTNKQEKVIVLGDFNEFEFMPPLLVLEGKELVNLTNTISQGERYTYIYEGNGQTLDHIFVTHNLVDQVYYQQIHINSEFIDKNSDHDPIILFILSK